MPWKRWLTWEHAWNGVSKYSTIDILTQHWTEGGYISHNCRKAIIPRAGIAIATSWDLIRAEVSHHSVLFVWRSAPMHSLLGFARFKKPLPLTTRDADLHTPRPFQDSRFSSRFRDKAVLYKSILYVREFLIPLRGQWGHTKFVFLEKHFLLWNKTHEHHVMNSLGAWSPDKWPK